jgi:serpin B
MRIMALHRKTLALLCVAGYGFLGMALANAQEPDWIGQANNAFAIDLYAKLAPGNSENLFFSPNSIETALAMTYAGARADTAKQMAAVLHLPPDSSTVHKDLGNFIAELNGEGAQKGNARSYQLSVANALWGQAGFHFLPDFVSLLKTNYGAGFQEVDFLHNAEAARQTINAWVEKETHDKIQNLIAPGILNPATELVLTNTIYFKGTWATPFEKKATQEQPFHISAGDEKKVPMMQRTGNYRYAEGADFKALKLPYAGYELSMIVLLPNAVGGLPQLEKELTTSTKLSDFLDKFDDEKVVVSMPRFQMTDSFELGPTLISMGMEDAFGGRADFSGMTGTRKLFISNVIHKAFVDVNEQGTEAAAATAPVMGYSMAFRPQPPKVFRADHPFLFVIRDERSGAILFMGRLVEPD